MNDKNCEDDATGTYMDTLGGVFRKGESAKTEMTDRIVYRTHPDDIALPVRDVRNQLQLNREEP